MKIVEAREVHEKLAMVKCIELMKEALLGLSSGKSFQPLRSINPLPHGESFGFMPAYLGEGDYFGAKVITAFPQNAGTEYPSHMGYVMLFEAEHGSFVGMADASAITEIRTGAVSGVATELLSRKDSHRLALIGTGAQARSHLAAMLAVRTITEVTVYDVRKEAAEKFAESMMNKYDITIKVCSSPKEAVSEADIICTLTPSKEPFLEASWVKPGTHINAVGTFTPVTREVTSELVAKSKLYADYKPSMLKECGEYLIPLAEGLIDESHIKGDLGGVLIGKVAARETEDEITLFDALGLAVEDVICAKYVCLE